MKHDEIEIDDDKYIYRKLTQGEVETLTAKYGSKEKGLEGARYMVSQAVVKEPFGDRRFPDMIALRDMDFDTINQLAGAVMTFSGLKDPEKKDAAA